MMGSRLLPAALLALALAPAGARAAPIDERNAAFRIIGEAARVGARNELLTGVRVWAGAELAEGSVRFSSDAS